MDNLDHNLMRHATSIDSTTTDKVETVIAERTFGRLGSAGSVKSVSSGGSFEIKVMAVA